MVLDNVIMVETSGERESRMILLTDTPRLQHGCKIIKNGPNPKRSVHVHVFTHTPSPLTVATHNNADSVVNCPMDSGSDVRRLLYKDLQPTRITSSSIIKPSRHKQRLIEQIQETDNYVYRNEAVLQSPTPE